MNKEKFDALLKKTWSGLKWFGKSFIWVMPVLFAIDLITKFAAEANLANHSVVVIKGFFTLELLYNKGAAWGSFSQYTIVLVIISLVASLGMIFLLAWKWKKLNWWYRVCLFLMISGALGNFIDRLRCAAFGTEGVIDFLKFTFGTYNFPTFNLADSYLTVGAIILVIYVLFSDLIFSSKKKEPQAEIKENDSLKKNDEYIPEDKGKSKDGK